ncbi:MAG: hypothetical protein QOG80_3260 [Pseudonocardiales bacterium]|nr:hypothetical protein [Pseudonocardiales bacterium]
MLVRAGRAGRRSCSAACRYARAGGSPWSRTRARRGPVRTATNVASAHPTTAPSHRGSIHPSCGGRKTTHVGSSADADRGHSGCFGVQGNVRCRSWRNSDGGRPQSSTIASGGYQSSARAGIRLPWSLARQPSFGRRVGLPRGHYLSHSIRQCYARGQQRERGAPCGMACIQPGTLRPKVGCQAAVQRVRCATLLR